MSIYTENDTESHRNTQYTNNTKKAYVFAKLQKRNRKPIFPNTLSPKNQIFMIFCITLFVFHVEGQTA